MFLPNRSRSNKDKAELIRSFSKDVMPGFKNKVLKPIIDRVVKVDWKDITPVKTEKKKNSVYLLHFLQVQEAHKYMESNRNIGKIVFDFQE